MNFVPKPIVAAPKGVAIVDDPASLGTFLQPAVAAAVWQRQTPSAVQSWLDQRDPQTLPQGRIVLPTKAIFDAVGHLFDIAGMPEGPERNWLHLDIVALADLVADLLQVKYIRLHLQPVTTNACRKFHIDAITARLVCTYRGRGTQYGISSGGHDPAHIFTVPTGAPILLRGTLWPPETKSGLLHRSPPIEGTNETRLVLVLDPVFDPDDET